MAEASYGLRANLLTHTHFNTVMEAAGSYLGCSISPEDTLTCRLGGVEDQTVDLLISGRPTPPETTAAPTVDFKLCFKSTRVYKSSLKDMKLSLHMAPFFQCSHTAEHQ